MKTTALLCLLLIAGCAAPQNRYTVNGTEHSVTVNWAGGKADGALPEAEKHCAKYGKHAQFAGKVNDFTAAFNCAS